MLPIEVVESVASAALAIQRLTIVLRELATTYLGKQCPPAQRNLFIRRDFLHVSVRIYELSSGPDMHARYGAGRSKDGILEVCNP